MKAIFAAGCFWGVEEAFSKLKGVKKTSAGYTGGTTKNPSYEDICSNTTGHTEAIEIYYDPKKISYKELLKTFWAIHNPTTKNRQGLDIGSQYRSAIFYHTEEQRKEAEESRNEEQNNYKKEIVTEITKASTFYKAEEYHQEYNKKHGVSCRIN